MRVGFQCIAVDSNAISGTNLEPDLCPRAPRPRETSQRSPDTSLLFGAVFGDPAPVSFGERAPESGGFKVAAVSRRSGLLPPGLVQHTTIE